MIALSIDKIYRKSKFNISPFPRMVVSSHYTQAQIHIGALIQEKSIGSITACCKKEGVQSIQDSFESGFKYNTCPIRGF